METTESILQRIIEVQRSVLDRYLSMLTEGVVSQSAVDQQELEWLKAKLELQRHKEKNNEKA